MINKYDSRDYVDYITGHFLNSLDYNIDRIEAIVLKQSEEWLHWNTNVVGGKDPVVLPEEEYEIMKKFFLRIGKELAKLNTTITTTMKLLMAIKIDDSYPPDSIGKKATYEAGWFAGRTLWTNFNALLDMLRLHLKELRSIYNNKVLPNADVLVWKNALKTHCQTIQELIKNVLFSLNDKLEEIVISFKEETF